MNTIEDIKKIPYVKLNVGCGNKYYDPAEGWVNVDLFGEVDFKADVRTLADSLGENIADEIHAYHVIEHFFKEEVPIVLNHWYRVLKPGGRVVLEQPDAVKCAINFLQFATTKDPKIHEQMGLKGFFGDIRLDKPECIIHDLHKWMWHPQSLGDMLSQAGFINIEEQDPITHARGVRDFRMVGIKPE